MKLTTETTSYGLPDIPILEQAGEQIGTGVANAVDQKLRQYYLIAGIVILFIILKK